MKELRKYLILNSLFSGTSGIIMLTATGWLNSIFHISNPYVFSIIGANLLGFGLFVWCVSKEHLQRKFLIQIISFLDGLWVAGSIVIIAFQLFELSKAGYVLIALVAVWVGFLGFKQVQYNGKF